MRAGKIKPLAPSEPLTEDVIDRATHIVGMMGTEPVERAIEQGADVVLCGRISDSAMFAAVPIMRGVPPEQAWHMAKVIDHSGTNIEPTRGVATHVIGVASDDHFLIQATDPHGRVSAHRAAHATTYENNSPNYLYEPPGVLDISDSQYEQLDDRTIKVTGSRFEERPYTIKLEGAELIGYRTITLGGTRDPVLISVLDEFLEICKRRTAAHAAAQGITEDDFKLLFRVYGRNEVMREWDPEQDFVPKEVGIVADCVADTQETANAVMNMCHAQLLHYNYPGRIHTTGNFAFPYSPLRHRVRPRLSVQRVAPAGTGRPAGVLRDRDGGLVRSEIMAKLKDLAYVIRSKNAGPFEVTLDILFENETIYRRVRDTGAIDAKLFARLYGVPESQCNFIAFDKGWSFKCTLVRPIAAGEFEDMDVYGCQQYAGLLEVEVPLEE